MARARQAPRSPPRCAHPSRMVERRTQRVGPRPRHRNQPSPLVRAAEADPEMQGLERQARLRSPGRLVWPLRRRTAAGNVRDARPGTVRQMLACGPWWPSCPAPTDTRPAQHQGRSQSGSRTCASSTRDGKAPPRLIIAVLCDEHAALWQRFREWLMTESRPKSTNGATRSRARWTKRGAGGPGRIEWWRSRVLRCGRAPRDAEPARRTRCRFEGSAPSARLAEAQ